MGLMIAVAAMGGKSHATHHSLCSPQSGDPAHTMHWIMWADKCLEFVLMLYRPKNVSSLNSNVWEVLLNCDSSHTV